MKLGACWCDDLTICFDELEEIGRFVAAGDRQDMG